MLTTTQYIILFIITELLVWDLVTKALNVIAHCSSMKAYRKAAENGFLNNKECEEIINQFNNINEEDLKNGQK